MQDFIAKARDFLPILLQGAETTVGLTIAALILSTLLGLVLAVMRYSGFAPLVWISKTLVNTIRGIPILVQLFYIYFVLPEFGIELTAFQAGSIGLGIAYSCYMAENFRAGLEAVDHGQIEAAHSIAMPWGLMMRRVIIPQAMPTIVPATGNQFIGMFKETSLVSVLGVGELLQSVQLIYARTYQTIPLLIVACVWYLVMTIALSYPQAMIEKKFSRTRARVSNEPGLGPAPDALLGGEAR